MLSWPHYDAFCFVIQDHCFSVYDLGFVFSGFAFSVFDIVLLVGLVLFFFFLDIFAFGFSTLVAV